MREAVIVSTSRTPIGKAYKGAYNNTNAPQLGGFAIKNAVEKAGINPEKIDDVITFGQQLGKLIVVTRGEKGSVAINKNQIIECESKKNLDIKDLTGAGDLFAAGYLHGYVNNLTIAECLEKGTNMSSKIIQQIGARLI